MGYTLIISENKELIEFWKKKRPNNIVWNNYKDFDDLYGCVMVISDIQDLFMILRLTNLGIAFYYSKESYDSNDNFELFQFSVFRVSKSMLINHFKRI